MPWFELLFLNGQRLRIEAKDQEDVKQRLEAMQPGLARAVVLCNYLPAEVG